jgi:hypothetical protein
MKHEVIVIILVMVFVSAWITEVIGVHAIFGAFLLGVVTPRVNGFAIRLTERIEVLCAPWLLPRTHMQRLTVAIPALLSGRGHHHPTAALLHLLGAAHQPGEPRLVGRCALQLQLPPACAPRTHRAAAIAADVVWGTRRRSDDRAGHPGVDRG